MGFFPYNIPSHLPIDPAGYWGSTPLRCPPRFRLPPVSEEKPEKTNLDRSREYIGELRDIEFQARSTAERLAKIGLTIEVELKQT